MTPETKEPAGAVEITTKEPINKVKYGAIAAAAATITLSLMRRYVWPDMPADLEGPLNTIIAALVVGAASGVAGYFTPLAPGEVRARRRRGHDDPLA